MGLFNVVAEVPARCPHCQSSVLVNVQFKFGETWQHRYVIGDALRWGRPCQGTQGRPRVVVDGAAEDCPMCAYDGDWDFYVFIEHDHIVAVTPADGTYDFVRSDDTYIDLS